MRTKRNILSNISPNYLIILLFILIAFKTGDTKSEYNVPVSPYCVYSTDYDSDGDNDIVIGHIYNSNINWTGISYLTNNGDGYFTVDTFYFGGGHKRISVGFLDDNNNGDLITQYNNGNNPGIGILFDFMESQNNLFSINLPYYADYLAKGDINGDGKMDIVLAFNSEKQVAIVYNNGNGSFNDPIYYTIPDYWPIDIRCSDLNNDNRDDIIIAGQYTEIWLSYPDSFQVLTFNILSALVRIADFDNDGDEDIFCLNPLYPGSDVITFIENTENGLFSALDPFLITPKSHFTCEVMDYDNDSLPDIMAQRMDSIGIIIYRNKGKFNFSGFLYIPMDDYGESGRLSYPADFDNNGYMDIVTVRSMGIPLPSNVSFLFNDGEGNFVEDPFVGIQSDSKPDKSTFSCYPNPAASNTTITFALENTSFVNILIYNITGSLQKTLFDNIKLEKGRHSITFDTENMHPGLYFIKLNIQNNIYSVIKLIVN